MNSNDENSKIYNDTKNFEVPVSTKEHIRHSQHCRHDLRSLNTAGTSQLGNRANGNNNLGVSTAITKRLSSILTEKGPKIHDSNKKVHADRASTEHVYKAASKIVRKPRSQTKQEKKYSTVLLFNEKSNTLSSLKQQSTLKTDRNTVKNDFNDTISKKTSYKTNWRRSLPKAKDDLCKIIQTSAERSNRPELKDNDSNGKRDISSQSAAKTSKKFNKKQENWYTKKYLEKVNVKDRIRPKNLVRIKETKETDPREIVEIKKNLRKKTICINNYIDANVGGNGAARTRIFKGVDKIQESRAECSKDEFGGDNPSPAKKHSRNEKENKSSDLKQHDNGAQRSLDSCCTTKDVSVSSLCQKGLATPESSSGCNQYQEFREVFVNLDEERSNDNSSFATSGKTSCKQTLTINTKIDSSQGNVSVISDSIQEACLDENVSRIVETESITDSTKAPHHEYEEISKTLTITNIPSASQDEIEYHTNLMNYGYNSDQQCCKRSNKQQDKKYTADAATRIIGVNKTDSTVNEDAKYNLMKALIQPATDIHVFKGRDNNVRELLMSSHRSESVITCRDEGLQICSTYSLRNSGANEITPNESSSVNRSQGTANDLKSCETLNSCTSGMDLRKPLSNTSDYIATNLKMKSGKYNKKYRHSKYDEKNMYCNMARYIKRIISDERKYQGFDKVENPEREEVKIIIDENSPKTSKIRIVNDRSSVSVVCHSFGRTFSSDGRKNTTVRNTAESSGGESSGYKSFNNNSNTEIEGKSEEQNVIEHSEIMTSRNPRYVHEQHHNLHTRYNTSAESFRHKADVRSSTNVSGPEDFGNQANGCVSKIEDLGSERNVYDKERTKRNAEIKYRLHDTNNYLSTFTNCMDVYLPCEITAYQFEERKRSKILHLNNEELGEKDVDNAELQIGRYLTSENSEIKDESSLADESSEQLSSETDITTVDNEVIVLKEPDNLQYQSLEFVVPDRLVESNNLVIKTDSSDIPVIPAQYGIVTPLLDIKRRVMSQSSEILANASDGRSIARNDESETDVKTGSNNFKTNNSSNTFPPVPPVPSIPQVITKDTSNKKSGTCGTACLGRLKNKKGRLEDSNAVHELWTNIKSTVDSTDNDSQTSGRSFYRKSHPKKHDTNKLKINIFRKSKSSASEKTINIPLNQIPEPSPSFSESAAPSQSSIFSASPVTDTSQLDIAIKSHASAASLLLSNSLTKSPVDTTPIHYIRKSHANTISNENINRLRLETSGPVSIVSEDTETHSKSSDKPPLDRSQEPHATLPPPPSALPPYPFCCPLVPYMMRYWNNNQQPPPASTVPLPEANWKPTFGMAGSEPPPAGMVPIPWFPQMMNINNPPTNDGADSTVSNNLRPQPPPEWLMMPRGYAPCLPCSKTPESQMKRGDSLSYEDDDPALEISENKPDGKPKKVSNKLFKIFQRKNRADVDTLDEDDKKGKYRPRPEPKLDNEPVVHKGQRNTDERSIWESPDIAGIVTPEEIGRCFRRGFRADGLTLSGDDYLCTRAPSDTTSEHEDIFNFSDHDTPLDFLLALGFSVDEATAAIRDEEVRSRFKAALTEARIWVPHIATTQGTLLYLLAMKAKPKVMRYFLQLVESIVNKRITNAVKLDAYLKILEKVEEGYVSFVTLFGKNTGKDDEEDTLIVEKQRRRIFYTIYKYAESEAKEIDRPLTKASVDLLQSLAGRYRSAIGPHLRLLACYIAEGLLTKDVQLEAALIYLSRLDSGDVKLADLEKYCGLPPSERRRLEKIEKKEL